MEEFESVMLHHFTEEEALIPELRRHFTYAEFASTMKEAMKDLPWYALPQVLRPLNREGAIMNILIERHIHITIHPPSVRLHIRNF